jgi:hypothetical protein
MPQLDMARTLARGGVTPAELRQKCRASEQDLVAFLQACLLLSMVSWRPLRLPGESEVDGAPDAQDDVGSSDMKRRSAGA